VARQDVRHQLKEDRFRKFYGGASPTGAVEHRSNLIKASVAIVIVLGLAGWRLFFTSTIAMNWPAGGAEQGGFAPTNTPIRPGGFAGGSRSFPTFASLKERADQRAHAV